MIFTEYVLTQPSSTCLDALATEIDKELKKKDLLATIAREMFNASMPTLRVKNYDDFIKALKIGLSAKFADMKSLKTIDDFVKYADEAFTNKISHILLAAIAGIGTHVPKMQSTLVPDPAVSFSTDQTTPKTGITSLSMDNTRKITGSKDGKYISGYGFLSASYQINNNAPKSLFQLLIEEDEYFIGFLKCFYDVPEIEVLISTAKKKVTEAPSMTVSQFQKQNFVDFCGKKIVVTNIQSVETTVALRQRINKMFEQRGYVNTKRYFAGGANSQNVSALNQDIGGGIPHLKAWIPSNVNNHDVFYYAYLMRSVKLNLQQKVLVKKLAWIISRIEDKGSSNQNERTAIENVANKITVMYLENLSLFADEISLIDNPDKLERLRLIINQDIKNYLTATSKADKSDASESIAFSLIDVMAKEMKRNKLDHNVGINTFNIIQSVLEGGKIKPCHML